jgi:lipoprotein-anchoring transpeptidase ErfK/SrfK
VTVRVAALLCASILGGAAPVALAADPPAEGTIAADVSIDGVPVGGFSVDAARRAVIDARVAPRVAVLVVSLKGRRTGISPQAAGWSADLDGAIAAALTYGRTVPVAGPVDVPLVQRVDRAKLRAVLSFRAPRIELVPVDATLLFRNGRPSVRRPRIGTVVDIAKAVPLVADAMVTRATPFVDLPVKRVRPAKMTVGTSIVINRATRVLTLYREARKVRTFRIAVGTSSHPTPRGLFSIVMMQRNPTWFPPDSPWAEGLGPVSPGPGNPLGTRWMGTSAPAVGIHGTPASSSIGTAASHGCIRMYIRDAEWLYERIRIGTPVLIR